MYTSVAEFSKITGLPKHFIQELCRSRDFPAVQSKRKYFIDKEAAIQYLKRQNTYREYVKTDRRKAV